MFGQDFQDSRFGLARAGIWLPTASGGLPGAPGGRERLAKSSEGAHAPHGPLISNDNHPGPPTNIPQHSEVDRGALGAPRWPRKKNNIFGPILFFLRG